MPVVKRSLVFLAFIAALAATRPAEAATCPFNIPVVTIPPHTVDGFTWSGPIRPFGDACIETIEVDPANDNAWYAGSPNGLYMTKNAGLTWTMPIAGFVKVITLLPGSPTLVYAGVGNDLYLSRDNGLNWTIIHSFPKNVYSVLASGGRLFVGLGWDNHVNPSGIYVSNLGGGFMTFHPFGPGQTGLIVWTLARDPLSGIVFAGTEIFDHPQPYHPPYFRSTDNGVSWMDVSGSTINWHVVASAVRPQDGLVYALTEGFGTYRSSDFGATWQPPVLSPGLGCGLKMDPNLPTRLYAGTQMFGTVSGGVYRSTNSAKTFWSIGMQGVTVCDIALNGSSTRIYVAAYGSGIYRATVP